VPVYPAARRVPSNDAKMFLFSILAAQSAARDTPSDRGNYLDAAAAAAAEDAF